VSTANGKQRKGPLRDETWERQGQLRQKRTCVSQKDDDVIALEDEGRGKGTKEERWPPADRGFAVPEIIGEKRVLGWVCGGGVGDARKTILRRRVAGGLAGEETSLRKG